ncbi:MAG: hypothetical protein JO032_02190 [Alphaproteobacteria bacterium]|nr:hypothetical protein [Alphaproteobacteria bacterium]MBV9551580.1 hypothetical protein [Alphaproteobacteria bacterium]
MHSCEPVGYFASGLVLAAFGMKDMVKLRVVAIGSNLVFIAYALGLGLAPIWLLHAVLLPLNIWRLFQAFGIEPWAALQSRLPRRLGSAQRRSEILAAAQGAS